MKKGMEKYRQIGLAEAKSRLVEMAAYLDKKCDENGLTLFMSGGTLLGAVRHKGFIPWDDDIDLYLSRPEYDRLIEIFRAEGNCGRYKLLTRELDGKYRYTYAKLVDARTRLFEGGGEAGTDLGLYVDIFPVDGLGDSVEQAKRQMKKANFYITLNLALLVSPWRKNVSFLKNLAIAFLRRAALLYGEDRLHEKLYALARSLPYGDSVYVGEYIDETGDRRIMNREEIYGGYVLMDFEGIKLKAPVGWDKWLTLFYGDYMTLPPEEKRVSLHDYELYDIDGENL